MLGGYFLNFVGDFKLIPGAPGPILGPWGAQGPSRPARGPKISQTIARHFPISSKKSKTFFEIFRYDTCLAVGTRLGPRGPCGVPGGRAGFCMKARNSPMFFVEPWRTSAVFFFEFFWSQGGGVLEDTARSPQVTESICQRFGGRFLRAFGTTLEFLW